MQQIMNADKGILRIKRERAFSQSAITFEIRLDERFVGNINNGRSIELAVPPGEHMIYLIAYGNVIMKSNPLTIEVVGGQIINLSCKATAHNFIRGKSDILLTEV